jgi:hypothetical protein
MKTGRMLLRLSAIAAAGALALAAGFPARAGSFSYTGSVQYSTGRYFFDRTTSGVYFFNGFSLLSGRFSLAASIPLIYQSTPYLSYTGVGVLPSGGNEGSTLVRGRRGGQVVILPVVTEYTSFGLGDPMFSAGLELVKESGVVPSLRVNGQVKLPVASPDRGFGTGEWDWSGGLALSKRFGGTFLFANLDYWVLGDLPELELENVWAYALALGRSFGGGKTAVIVSYYGSSRVIAEVKPASALGLGMSFRSGRQGTITLNGAVGLSEASPDFSLSLGWSVGL